MNLSKPIVFKSKVLHLINGRDEVACTILTSNHRAGNIIAPKGGRREMGILEYESEETR